MYVNFEESLKIKNFFKIVIELIGSRKLVGYQSHSLKAILIHNKKISFQMI